MLTDAARAALRSRWAAALEGLGSQIDIQFNTEPQAFSLDEAALEAHRVRK